MINVDATRDTFQAPIEGLHEHDDFQHTHRRHHTTEGCEIMLRPDTWLTKNIRLPKLLIQYN